MPAQTSGGLYKRSYQLSADTLAAVRRVAGERGTSESAAVRDLVTLGYRVYEHRRAGTGAVEDLAVGLVAREVA